MKKWLLSSVMLIAAPAWAADIEAPAAFDWTGPYVGLSAGAAILDDDLTAETAVDTFSNNDTETGILAGIQAGYNFQADNLLFGLEADISYIDVGSDLVFQGKQAHEVETDYDWFATIRGRAGFVADNLLLYGTGGLALIDFEAEGFRSLNGVLSSEGGPSKTLLGWTIGAGVEAAFTDNISAKIEYLYANFEDVDFGVPDGFGSADPELHVIRAGVNYHFWD